MSMFERNQKPRKSIKEMNKDIHPSGKNRAKRKDEEFDEKRRQLAKKKKEQHRINVEKKKLAKKARAEAGRAAKKLIGK